MHRLLILTLLAGLAGCAGGATWHKAGVSDEDLQRDIVDCRRQADAQAERQSYARGASTPIYEVDPNTGQVREVFKTERRAAEVSEKAMSQRLYHRCMLARGYQQN